MITLYYGAVINPQTLDHFDALPRCLIAIGPEGNIFWVENDIDPSVLQGTIAQHNLLDSSYTFVELKAGEFLLPGLIDTHIHACQFPNLGVGGDLELLEWLETYTFPKESKFGDLDYANAMYPDIVRRVIDSGTTTSCYYGSLHLESTKRLAEIVREKGQRAFVGKCNMNWHCPDYYREKTVTESVDATVDLISHIKALAPSLANEALVYPIITPRFAISCTPELLKELGKISETVPNVAIQTHISENQKEVEDTLKYFNAKTYVDIYDKYNLLRANTILAHGVWLSKKEMRLIAKRGAGVSHCPTSNFYLSSGIARVGMLLDHGVKVGLGTDVSGGYHPSILHAIQMASAASKTLAIQAEQKRHKHKHDHDKHSHKDSSDSSSASESESEDHKGHRGHGHKHGGHSHNKGKFTDKKLSVATLLYLATKGGAEVCCLQDRIGSFEEGKAFDALLVSIRNETGNPAVWGHELEEGPTAESNLRQWLERFLFCGDDRNIRKVFVQGAAIGGQEHRA